MEIDFYVLGLIVLTFIGFVIGIILSLIAPEEMKDGKKYFIILRAIIFVFIIFITCEILGFHILVSTALSLLIILFVLYKKTEHINYFFYIILGVVFAISYIQQELFILQASLIFIFGLPSGSLFKMERKLIKKDYINLMAYFLVYTLSGILSLILI